MTKDEVARLEAELETLHEAYIEAREAERLKRRELDEARVAYATANPHPWVGKKVSRMARVGYRNKTRMKRGTVALYDPAKHRGLRGLSGAYLKPGEPIVLFGTMSGAELNEGQNYRGEYAVGCTGWTLDEETK